MRERGIMKWWTLKREYSRELNRFIPLNPWHGGPPHSKSTSPFIGRRWPAAFFCSPWLPDYQKLNTCYTNMVIKTKTRRSMTIHARFLCHGGPQHSFGDTLWWMLKCLLLLAASASHLYLNALYLWATVYLSTYMQSFKVCCTARDWKVAHLATQSAN